MIKVQFYSVDEFMQEVIACDTKIEGGVVRVTNQYQQTHRAGSRVVVVATAVCIGADSGGVNTKPAGRWLLRLDVSCGDMLCVMGDASQPADELSAKVLDMSRRIFFEIENRVRVLGLVTRPGIFSEEGDSR